MAKLVDVYRGDKQFTLGKRQLPLIIDENLTMVMDLNSMGLFSDCPLIKGKTLDEFTKKCAILSEEEFKAAFEVTSTDMFKILSQSVPCVGCRRSVERLFYQLMLSCQTSLLPIVVTEKGMLSITEGIPTQLLCTLLHGHSTRLKSLVDNQPRSKKSLRCSLHSLDSQRLRPVGAAWCDVWDCMEESVKEEVLLIEASTLSQTLDNYLHKHRFCTECRTKVVKAYTLLVEEPNPTKEKGYSAALYGGIKRCLPEKHLHLPTKTEYIADLIMRAEPELLGRRERHAKTLEIAQEEVLTCLGICVYERLHRIHLRLKEEECTCQVFAAVVVDTLCRSFEMAVEKKQGISQLELLYEQITKEDQAKEQRKQNKKLKRRKKKERKNEQSICEQCETEPTEIENGTSVKENEPNILCSCESDKANNGNCACAMCKLKRAGLSGCKNKVAKKFKGLENNNLISKNMQIGRDNSHGIISACYSCLNAKDINDTHTTHSDAKPNHRLLQNGWSSSEHSHDCGYSSENNNGGDTGSAVSSISSSPYGSEVACSDGFCNHERGDCNAECSQNELPDEDYKPRVPRPHRGMSGLALVGGLQQMLDSSDEEENISYIPMEDVLEFKSRSNINEKREQLRQTLKKKFDQLCINKPNIQMRKCE